MTTRFRQPYDYTVSNDDIQGLIDTSVAASRTAIEAEIITAVAGVFAGRGSSGAINVNSGTPGTVVLAANVYATSYTLAAGVNVQTVGFMIFATLSVTVSSTSTIEFADQATINAAVDVRGAHGNVGPSQGNPGNGGTGAVGAGATGGAVASSIHGTVVDHGGDGGGGTGGATGGDGGDTTAFTATNGSTFGGIMALITGNNFSSGLATQVIGGGGGGSGRGDAAAGKGGGGGAGGGIVFIICGGTITIASGGAIRALGGNGGTVTGGVLAKGGGGGGGGGGLVTLAAAYTGSGYSVAGGTHGTGIVVTTGAVGNNGADGQAGTRMQYKYSLTGLTAVTP